MNRNVTIGHDSVLNDFAEVNSGAIVSGEDKIGTAILIGAAATILPGLSISDLATPGASACVPKKLMMNLSLLRSTC